MSRGRCPTYNGNSAARLEQAVLEYLSQFSDPERVREHMEAAEERDLGQRQAELDEVLAGISELESQFSRHLDLLKREVLNEGEFVKANEGIRSQRDAFEARKLELESWLEEQRGKVSAAEGMPQAIRSFMEDFQSMEVRVQKAHLQTILKAAHVHRDGRIELEFRG